MPALRPLTLLLLPALLSVAPLQAQNQLAPPPEQDSTAAGRRRVATDIAAIDDTLRLRRLERELSNTWTDPLTEALSRFRRGHVRLRLGQLGDDRAIGRALKDFERTAELRPDWSEAWEGRGLAQRAEGDRQAGNRLNLGKRVGFGSFEAAVESFAKAVEVDPGNAPAGRALYEDAALIHDTTRLSDVVLPALRRAAARGTADTAVLLALGRSERLMGDPWAAAAAFRRYLNAGGTRGLGLREFAWSLFVAGDGSGDSAYYAGAAANDAVSVAAYREDLALVAEDSILAEFDQTSGQARADLLRRFWRDRDRRALRTDGERLREHYRRITYAERHFGLEVNRRYFNEYDLIHSTNGRFDDRGLVYIRYGEPNDRAASLAWGIQPNESWRYDRADGDLLLHFAANVGGDIRDYRLIPSVTAIGGVDPKDGSMATEVAFNDRCRLYPPFCKYLTWGPYGRAKILQEERTRVLASVAWALTTDGDELRFSRGLEAAAAAFAVGQSGPRQLVHVAYQVALRTPDSLPEGATFRVPLRVRVNLFDDQGHSGAWADTTTLFLLPGGDATRSAVDAVGRVTLPVSSGHWHYQIALQHDDSTGIVLPTDSVDVGRFDGSQLAVSDLVLSRGGRGARWVPAEGDTAYFNPRRTWSRSDTIALYHEVYGLAAGSTYEAKLEVRRGRKVALTLSWEGAASAPVTRVARTVSFRTVRPGDYELTIEIVSADGGRAVSSRRIQITE